MFNNLQCTCSQPIETYETPIVCSGGRRCRCCSFLFVIIRNAPFILKRTIRIRPLTACVLFCCARQTTSDSWPIEKLPNWGFNGKDTSRGCDLLGGCENNPLFTSLERQTAFCSRNGVRNLNLEVRAGHSISVLGLTIIWITILSLSFKLSRFLISFLVTLTATNNLIPIKLDYH